MQPEDELLEAMGLSGLSGDAKTKTLENILYTLNMRLGKRLSETLEEDKLDDFNNLLSRDADQEELSRWFSANVPNYTQLIEEEAKQMIAEKDEILQKVIDDNHEQDDKL